MCSDGNDSSEFVSMDETSLEEARKKIANLVLSHEIVFNDDFRLAPTESAWNAMREDIDRILNSVKEELKDDNSDYGMTIALIRKIKSMLRDLVFPNKPTLIRLTEGCFDEDEVIMQIQTRTLDWDALISRVISCLGAMCSEARDPEIANIRKMADKFDQIRALIILIKHMHLDLANYLILSYRQVMRLNWKNYCRQAFDFIAGENEKRGLDSLKNAKTWFKKSIDMTGTSYECTLRTEQFFKQVVNLSFVRLIYPQENPPFPETIEIDLPQFLKIRFSLIQYFLLQCIRLIANQILLWNEEIEREVKVLLDDITVITIQQLYLRDIEEYLSSISVHILSKSVNVTKDTKTKIVKLINDLRLLEKHPVYSVLFKRFVTSIKMMLEMDYDEAIRYAAKNLETDLKDLAIQFHTLAKVNIFIFDDVYRQIIFTLAHEQ